MTMMVHSPSVFGFRNTDDIFADKRGFLINVNAKSQLCNVSGRMTKWNTKALRNIHLNSNIRQKTEFEDTTWLKSWKTTCLISNEDSLVLHFNCCFFAVFFVCFSSSIFLINLSVGPRFFLPVIFLLCKVFLTRHGRGGHGGGGGEGVLLNTT